MLKTNNLDPCLLIFLKHYSGGLRAFIYMKVKLIFIFSVQFVRNKNCQRCDYIPVSDNTGLIASSVTQETRCGSEQCPWLIKVDEGQKVKLSLFDYMTVNGIQSGSDGTCNAYMEIKDGDQRTPFNICRDRARGTKHLYTSVSNRVYVNIHVPSVNSAKKQERGNFLLKYEGNLLTS